MAIFNFSKVLLIVLAVVGQGSANGHQENAARHNKLQVRDAASALAAASSVQGAINAIIAALASGLLSAAGSVNKVPASAQAKWNWRTNTATGVCLGSWLTLERFMMEDEFVGAAGASAEDEWTFSANLGPVAGAAALRSHYASFITEADFDTMLSHGINHVRIPTGFWSWIPAVSGEPYINAGQLGYLTQAVAWASARGMYVLIDLHGLPGSQNGEQSSGHLTTSPSFFGNAVNQARSDQTLAAVIAFIAASPTPNAFSGIEVINEPRPYGDTQIQQLSDFYARSYNTIQASAHPIAMFLHPGYVANAFAFWRPFIQARVTNPPTIVIEDHPYPGNFPPQFSTSDMLSQVCGAANRYVGYPAPVAITEWSVYTGVKTSQFEQEFYESQVSAWSWGGGSSFYWSLRVIPSRLQLAAGLDYSQYSWVYLISRGIIPSGNSIGEANANAYIQTFAGDANCGPAPYNASPFP